MANYEGGTVAVFPIDSNGRVGEASDIVHHEGTDPDQDRQSAPHPHAIEPGPRNRFCYAPDLGADRIAIYRPDADTGELRAAETEPATARAGARPRQIAFHPTAPVCYAVDELDATVSEFRRDRESGALTAVGRTSTRPPQFGGDNAPAAVRVHPSDRWVYVSNRGHDSIAVFAVDRASGSLERVGHKSTCGETPRDITLSPGGEFLLAANQHGDSLVVFAIDGDGRLDARAELAVPKPVCVTVLDPR
ncbi:6-phosphogluconolactonase [Natrialba taiwanensis DSM 12281]|uniref:6-phosphogluconolactonase n=1 Tax=Natrialba taiwanensis DSM 12281 TaxID=1230458 RepID=M0A0R4_9EURY|nr:lactonase family protein [Natrialba taiwanensis]ELY92199.1 6-phosphogluconolactonase [Natrialba taiwanensis DSM 12281]